MCILAHKIPTWATFRSLFNISYTEELEIYFATFYIVSLFGIILLITSLCVCCSAFILWCLKTKRQYAFQKPSITWCLKKKTFEEQDEELRVKFVRTYLNNPTPAYDQITAIENENVSKSTELILSKDCPKDCQSDNLCINEETHTPINIKIKNHPPPFLNEYSAFLLSDENARHTFTTYDQSTTPLIKDTPQKQFASAYYLGDYGHPVQTGKRSTVLKN